MPKLDYFSPEKIQKWTILSQKSKSWTRFIQKNPKMDGKVIKNYQVISLPLLSTSEPYRMPSSRRSHPSRNRLCDGLFFTNRS